MAKKKKAKEPRPNLTFGMCRICLCTDEEGCPEGCEWADKSYSLCTRCEGLSESEELDRRAEAIQELSMRLDQAVDELEVLRWRLAVAVAQPIGAKPS